MVLTGVLDSTTLPPTLHRLDLAFRTWLPAAIVLAVTALPAAATVSGAGTAAAPLDWPAYGRTPGIANTVPAGLDAALAKRLRLVWARKLGGSVVAQPLYLARAPVAGGTRPLLFVATGANAVYALDARGGGVVWERSLGAPVTNVCGGAAGIASTPAVSNDHRRLYVIGANGKLFALDVATGGVVRGWPVTVVRRTSVEYVWSAVRVLDGKVLVPVGSHCDRPDAAGVSWDGRLVAVDTLTRRITNTLDVVPGPANGGSIWGWAGTSWDAAAKVLWTATANATFHSNGNLIEKQPLPQPEPLGVGSIALSAASAIGKIAVVDTRSGTLLNLLETGPAYAPLTAAGASIVSGSADGTIRSFRAAPGAG